MRILHVSDLHIGKRVAQDKERMQEYEDVLDELAGICDAEDIELVLIAGDVYDTSAPSSQAMRIFNKGVTKLARNAAVLVISGNHDDPTRLTAMVPFAENDNVYITGNDLVPITCEKIGRTYPVASGKGWVIMQTDPSENHPEGERVYVNLLPYPNEAKIGEEKTDETYQQKIDRWIAEGNEGNTEGLPSILLAHIFVLGGIRGESEREIELGGARLVDPAQLKGFDYCALGHIHRNMDIGTNAHYCGAPMQFAFDECGAAKYCNVFDLSAGKGVSNFHKVEIHSGVQLARLTENSIVDALAALEHNKDCYVELTLNTNAPITRGDIQRMHDAARFVIIRQSVTNTEHKKDYSVKNMSSSALFTAFYKKQYDEEPPADLLELFLSLTETEEVEE
ncbi:MAG: exonuclease subunit SbcD [Clostridia bacterium]|nr:exonuclease subunit SbcD [Clostridia bacterium]